MLDDAPRRAQPDESLASEEVDKSTQEPSSGSLADDVLALFEDGKTYFDAELAFQKTRASYAGAQTRQGLVYGLGALAFLHLALIGLVVGLIIALGPILTPWGALAAVVGALLVGVLVFAVKARRRFRALGDAFKDNGDGPA